MPPAKNSTNKNNTNAFNPGVLDHLGRGVLEAMKWFSKVTRETFDDYTPFDGVVDTETFFTTNGTLVSLYEMKGSTRFIGEQERFEFFKLLKDEFKTILRDSNTAIQFVYVRDKKSTEEYLNDQMYPLLGKAKQVGLDIDIILKERAKKMLPFMTGTNIYIAVSTVPVEIISSEQMKKFKQEKNKELSDLDFPSRLPSGMQYYCDPDAIMSRHVAICDQVERLFNDMMKIVIKKYNVHEAMYLYRTMLFPAETDTQWRARLPVQYKDKDGNLLPPDPIVQRQFVEEPYRQGTINGIEALLYPTLGRQLAGGAIDRGDGLDPIVRFGSRYCATQLLDMLPASPKSFETLMETVGKENIPFRLSFTFYGGAEKYQDEISRKKSMSVLAKLFGGKNKLVPDAAEGMLDFISKGGAVCGMSVQIATWHTDKSRCEDNIRKLGKAIDSWGGAQTVPEIGDAALAFTAGLPGWHDNLRHVLIHGYDYLLNSLPLNIIMSPWQSGTMLFLNSQGGLFPYQPLSSVQQTSNILCFAPPGGGKSVMISTMILGAVLDPVIEELPKVAVLDIGNSSKGIINLLRAASREKKDRFLHLEFELTDKFGINVMDTRLGCKLPTSVERGFLTNFITMIFTPVGKTEPIDNAADIATKLIEDAYRMTSEDAPHIYEPSRCPEVANFLREHPEFPVYESRTTWWQIVMFALSVKNNTIAALAQRYAVPTIGNLPAILVKSKTIQAMYKDEAGEKCLVEARRLLMGFIAQYPSLARNSTFNFQETDVCVIDLNKVTQDTGPEGTRRTAIAYMVSRYLLGKDFLLNKDILSEMSEEGQNYYRSQIQKLEVVRKYLIYDEFHRTGNVKSIRNTVTDDMRNGRKFNLMVMLASQKFTDFDEDMISISTTRFVMRVDDSAEADTLCNKYKWSDSIRTALTRSVRGNEGKYASFLLDASAIKIGKESQSTQVLRSVIGSTELAAYATTREDAALRDALLEDGMPYWECVRLLGKLYGGSVKELVEEQMKQKRSQRNSTEQLSEDEEIKGALGPFIRQIKDAYAAEQRMSDAA